ncbi:MFS transporter [Myxococcota bacterium]|nr:MFS transporter [Myxococcota bacterium]
MPAWLENLLPIVLLLVAVLVVLRRLPKVELGHSAAYKRRRVMNWVPLGLTYAFLYFGRYNLSAIVDLLDKEKLLSKAEFGQIDGVGAAVYGVSFLLNGWLTDRWGGRVTILIAAAGAAVSNLGMAFAMSQTTSGAWTPEELRSALLVLSAVNMYFQSFGAVSIVKVNAPWFHVRERGVLGGLFGILISLGLYFSYDWSAGLAKAFGFATAFWVPAAVLSVFFVIAFVVIRDTPSKAGFEDFDTGDATSGQKGALPLATVLSRMFAQPVIWIIVGIEFCSGFLRNAVMKWYRPYARAIGDADGFVYQNWGLLLCVAGILGGVFAGFISDYAFDSRRGPVASVLYGGLTVGALVAVGTLGTPIVGWSVVLLSLCVIGVHGMLSGTASMDFGGSKNAGVVTGIIDGFVYLGTSAQAFLYSAILPTGDAAKDAAAWQSWPGAMMPVAIIGLLLCTRVWNAKPKPHAAAH